MAQLVNVDSVAPIRDHVVRLLEHPRELVRKKAVLVLSRCWECDPVRESEHNEGARQRMESGGLQNAL